MSVKIISLITNEINHEQWRQILEIHNRIFGLKIEMVNFIKYYQNTITGFSFHCLAISENKIIGHTTLKPQFYRLNNIEIKGVLSGSSCIDEAYRKNIFLYMDMYELMKSEIVELGFKFSVGVPNVNSFQYATQIMGNLHIGNLNYYVVPSFNFKMLNWILNLRKNVKNERCMKLEKNNLYFKSRFDFPYYFKSKIGKNYYIYRVVKEGIFRVNYIMDHFITDQIQLNENASNKWFNFCFSIYVGTFNKFMFGFKIPDFLIKKKLPLVLDVFDNIDKLDSEIIKKIGNWEFDLANFDVR